MRSDELFSANLLPCTDTELESYLRNSLRTNQLNPCLAAALMEASRRGCLEEVLTLIALSKQRDPLLLCVRTIEIPDPLRFRIQLRREESFYLPQESDKFASDLVTQLLAWNALTLAGYADELQQIGKELGLNLKVYQSAKELRAQLSTLVQQLTRQAAPSNYTKNSLDITAAFLKAFPNLLMTKTRAGWRLADDRWARIARESLCYGSDPGSSLAFAFRFEPYLDAGRNIVVSQGALISQSLQAELFPAPK